MVGAVSELSLRRRTALLFLVAGLVIGTLALLMALSLARLDMATKERVDRLGPALLESEVLARSYSDQEAGLRGYLVAGRDDFLEPYVAGRAAERRSLSRLRTLLAGRPDLLARVAAVRDEARAWHDTVAQPAITRTRRDGASAMSVADVEVGKVRFERVRDRLAELQAPLRTAQEEAGASLTAYQDRLAGILVAGLLGLVVVAVIAWQALRRWVVEPLRDLGSEVDRVETGDLSRQMSVAAAPKEIMELTSQVERMRVRILHEYALAEDARAEAMAARSQLEVQAEDLRRSNAELEQFAHVVSHDLQEPLHSLAGFLELLSEESGASLDDTGQLYLQRAQSGVDRVRQLLRDLLEYARVTTHGQPFGQVDMQRVVDEVLAELDDELHETGAVVTATDLPTVKGDAFQLTQLMRNLLENAIKFRSESPPSVVVTADRGEGEWLFSVGDNGIGIDPRYAIHVFTIFQRLHGRDEFAGTGVGLAISKKIVERHQGRIWVESKPEGGATFFFTLADTLAVVHS